VRIFVHAGTAVDKVGSGLQEIHSARLGAVHALPETVAPVICPRDKPAISRRGSLLPEADEHLSLLHGGSRPHDAGNNHHGKKSHHTEDWGSQRCKEWRPLLGSRHGRHAATG